MIALRRNLVLAFLLLLFLLCLSLSKANVASDTEEQAWTDSSSQPQQTGEQKHSPNKTGNDYVNEEYENELRLKKAEALRLKQLREKKKSGEVAVKRAIRANASDRCDLTSNPLRFINGKLCGSHYKVLQLDRFNDEIDKNAVKKAYRQLSLTVHPDKNPADDATTAFKIIQDAYECLSDDSCKKQYDTFLLEEEARIQLQRAQLQEKMIEKAVDGLHHAHNYATKASNMILTSCRKVWEWAGELTIPIGDSDLPLGKIVVSLLAISQFKLSFPLIGLAILIAKFNEDVLHLNQRQQQQRYYDNYRYHTY